MNTRLYDLLAREKISVAALKAIHDALRPHPDYAASATWALRQLDADKAWRAAWLLKRIAQGGRLAERHIATIAECAEGMDHWLARLTLCQLFAFTGCPPPHRDALLPYLEKCATDRHSTVRAWALTALLRFENDPECRTQVQVALQAARVDPGKAVQARLRCLRQRSPSGLSARRARRA